MTAQLPNNRARFAQAFLILEKGFSSLRAGFARSRRWLAIPKRLNALHCGQSGVSLLETVIAVAIMGSFVSSLFVGLAGLYKMDFILGKRTYAESLAKSQIESTISQSYIDYADPGHGTYPLITALSPYEVEIAAAPINPATGEPLAAGYDDGMQKVTVTVRYHDEEVITLESYKADR